MSEPKNTSSKFPNNYRFITEFTRGKEFLYIKIFCFSFITTFLLVSVMLKGYQLLSGINTLQAATTKREALRQEQAYWEDVVTRHPGYRDAEFKLAVLSYQLGEKDKAKRYMSEVFAIDPNFTKGREFAKQVGL